MVNLRLFPVLVFVLFGCAGQEPALRLDSPVEPPHLALPTPVRAKPPAASRPARQSVVLITIDGVRWQEVFQGVDRRLAREHGMAASQLVGPAKLVPELHALAAGAGAALGAPGHGEPISASDHAVKSLPGYMEIASGRRTTGCSTNACPRIDRTTVIDQIAAQPASSIGDVAVIASWSGIAHAAAEEPSRIVMSAGRITGNHLDQLRFDAKAEKLLSDGRRAGPLPGSDDYRPDRNTAAIALHYLRARHPRFLFIGLGDTDEWGHRNDYKDYLGALQRADKVVGKVARTLASLHEQGWETAFFVTADHGRDPECRNHGGVASAMRTWLVAGGSLIRAHGLVSAPEPRHLADIAPTLRQMMGVQADTDADAGHVLAGLLAPAHADERSAQLERD
jgi:hypothetical protein